MTDSRPTACPTARGGVSQASHFSKASEGSGGKDGPWGLAPGQKPRNLTLGELAVSAQRILRADPVPVGHSGASGEFSAELG